MLAALEAARASFLSVVNTKFDELASVLKPSADTTKTEYKLPTLADGQDPRNKNGLNLTPRGVEILYRIFDDDGGYNRAGKMLNITQAAAKNRKSSWVKLGGKDRLKERLDID